MIGNDDIAAGAFHREQGLHNDPLFIDPALGSSRFDHGVFT